VSSSDLVQIVFIRSVGMSRRGMVHPAVDSGSPDSSEITALREVARPRRRSIHTGVPMRASQMALMLEFMGVEGLS
jgi:hypothetical protein